MIQCLGLCSLKMLLLSLLPGCCRTWGRPRLQLWRGTSLLAVLIKGSRLSILLVPLECCNCSQKQRVPWYLRSSPPSCA